MDETATREEATVEILEATPDLHYLHSPTRIPKIEETAVAKTFIKHIYPHATNRYIKPRIADV